MDQDMSQPARKSSKKIVFIVIAIIIILGIIYFAMNRGTAAAPGTAGTADQTAAAQGSQLTAAESKEIVAQISKFIIVPAGEEPVVARVTDEKALIAEQLFYKDVKNGDYLVIYPKAAKAIIYSPSRNRLVNVGPIQVADDGKVAPATGTTPAKTK